MIDVFAVGVKIGVEGNASQFLAMMLKDLTGVEVAAGKVSSQLNKMKTLAIAAGEVFIGGAMIRGMTELLNKGIAFNQELAKMKMANYSPGDIKSLTDQAYKTTTDVPGTNLLDNLKSNVDLRNVSGAAQHAVALSETMARVNAVLANISGKPAEAAGFNFMKFLEDSGRMMGANGQFSEERVAQQARWMEAVIAATNGRVDGSSEFQFRQAGKSSVNALSDVGLTNIQPIIMSLGASQTGTGLQGIGTQLLGATQLYGHTVAWLEGHGMLDPHKVHKLKGGRYSLDKGAITGSDELNSDPVGWIWNVLSKHLKNKDGSEMSISQKISDLRSSGLLRTSLGLIVEAIQNEVTQRKEIGNINRASGVDQYDVMNENSPTFRITKFSDAWENLQIALGKTIDVTQFLTPFTNALNVLDAEVMAHPDVARKLIELTYAVGGFLALDGSLKLFTIAIGPMTKGLIKLTGMGTGVATVGTGLGVVAGGLAALAAPVTVLIGLLAAIDKYGKTGADDPQSYRNMKEGKNPDGSPRVPDTVAPPAGGRHGPGAFKTGQADAPLFVHVVGGALALNNPGDIGRSLTNGLADGTSRPQSGPTFQDYRFDTPTPGFALG